MAEIGIPEGRNALNVSGDIQALYPRPTSVITFSQVLMAARFNLRFDIAPAAVPFTVAAVGDASSMVFVVDPVTGRITGKSQVATCRERILDFSQTSANPAFSVVDFLNNGAPVMWGNVVHVSRLDPYALDAMRYIPYPNAGPGEVMNFLYDRELPSSGTVVLDNFVAATRFGNFLPIPYAPYLASRSAEFKLYVDGKLIASDKVVYSLPLAPQFAPAVSLKDLTLKPASAAGGRDIVEGTVSLTGPASAAGAVVTLQSDNAAASVPATVTVSGGTTWASFWVNTRTVPSIVTVTITAKMGSDSKTVTLTLTR